jgi:hypothetical protein
MSNDLIGGAEPERLASLMGPIPDVGWDPQDFPAILDHQLRAPLVFDGTRVAPPPEPAGQARDHRIRSFGELLAHPSPPRELLLMMKSFAKDSDVGGAPLPQEVASVLYFAAIAAGLLRLGERITTLDDAALRQGLEWCCARPWLTKELVDLFAGSVPLLGDDAPPP